MKHFKLIICIALWAPLIWFALHKLSQGIHDENVIYQMASSTYEEISDTLTVRNGGIKPSEHQIVTYYYERFKK